MARTRRMNVTAKVTREAQTQTTPLTVDVAVQTPGCSECLSLIDDREDSLRNTCVQCELVNDLLYMVAELKEEVERLRNSQGNRKKGESRDGVLPTLRDPRELEHTYTPHIPQHEVAERNLVDEGEWEQVSSRGGKAPPSCPPPPSQTPPYELPLQNRFGVLDFGDQEDDTEGGTPPSKPTGTPSPTKRIKTSSLRRKRRVVVVGDSFLRGTEGPVCRPDPSHREVCCLPGARVQDISERLPKLIQPSDYYPLLVVQAGSDEINERGSWEIKEGFKDLGRLISGAGMQVIFCSVPVMAGSDSESTRRILSLNKWLKGWCHQNNIGFYDHGMSFTKPGLTDPGGPKLSNRGKRVLAQGLTRLVHRALN